jgi:hypothetical protein
VEKLWKTCGKLRKALIEKQIKYLQSRSCARRLLRFWHGRPRGAPTYLSLYVAGLNLSTPPTATIGGTPVNVTFYGNAPCCAGLRQINVELPPSLAGAGRVEVAVTAGGMVSNVVEIVILPSPGQGLFPRQAENMPRARELADVDFTATRSRSPPTAPNSPP